MKVPPPSSKQTEKRLALLRARQTEALAALKQRLAARKRPVAKKEEPRRRRWWMVAVLMVLLWMLVCGRVEAPAPATAQPSGPAALGEAVVAEVPVPDPPSPSVRKRDRPDFAPAPPTPLPWVASYRIQVAARSPRLAACFVGADRPGRLKWTASVEPSDGHVSEHVLEPMFATDALTAEQRTCVIGVLSDPPYKLGADARSTPSRVAMVIEF